MPRDYDFSCASLSFSVIFDYVMAEGGDEGQNGRMNSLTGLQRIYRGIVDDCCLKPCSKATMKKYCRD